MKRVIIVVAMLALILLACWYSLHRVNAMRDEMFWRIEEIFVLIDTGDKETLRERVAELVAYWAEEEEVLIRFVRHAQVDEVTKSVAKLPIFAVFEDWSELSAELSVILWQVEHIWRTEQPWVTNVL